MTIATVGHNQPPSAVDLAKPIAEDVGKFLADHPVLMNEDEARTAKLQLDRFRLALEGIEAERKTKVDPLNAQVKAINGEYHKWHNADPKKPTTWSKLLDTLRLRMSAYALRLEQERREAAEAARKAKEEAERIAREAEEREREATETAAAGVCDVDIAAATEEADEAFSRFKKADRELARAERDTKVRLGGGLGKVSTLRTKETLTVTDWRKAIDEMSDDDGEIPIVIYEAILTAARAYRRVCERLPAGIQREIERSL